jgi:hypothetical protein
MERANVYTVDPNNREECAGELLELVRSRSRSDPALKRCLTRYLLARASARRGDIVKIARLGERPNDWAFIFDGREVQELAADPEIDYFASVPPDFRIFGPEGFGPKHWSEAVAHNRVVWFDASPFARQVAESLPHWRSGGGQLSADPRPHGFTSDFLRQLFPLGTFVFPNLRMYEQPKNASLKASCCLIAVAPEIAALLPATTIASLLSFALSGPLPWEYCPSADPQAERVLVIGRHIYARWIYGDPCLAKVLPRLPDAPPGQS